MGMLLRQQPALLRISNRKVESKPKPLKQRISDQEKFVRVRNVFERYRMTGHFANYTELAEYLDYHRNTLYQIAAGSRNPPDILIYKFCEYFELNPAYFFGRADNLTAIKGTDHQDKDKMLQIQKLSLEIARLTK